MSDLVDIVLEVLVISPEIEVFEEIELVFGFCVVDIFGVSQTFWREGEFELFEMELFGYRFVISKKCIGSVVGYEVDIDLLFGAFLDEIGGDGATSSEDDDAL